MDSASIGSGSRGIKCAGSKCISRELRDLVIQMVAENSSWSTLPIHGELNIPGFDISERKVLWVRDIYVGTCAVSFFGASILA
jgi:hypothetical protein